MIRILVTAFGAFPGAPSNPTMAIADGLQKSAPAFRRAGIDIRTLTLPVIFEGTRERLSRALQEVRPDAVLHLGLAGRRKAISVETRALNRLTIVHNDAGRRLSGSLHVEKHGAAIRRSRFGAQRLAVRMSGSRAPTRVSIDAGDYLCNQVLYLSLGLHEGICGFIHVPRPRRLRLPRNRPGSGSRPPLSAITRAIETAVRQIAIDARVQRRAR